MRPIRIFAVASLIAVAAVLSGCFVIQSETVTQLDVIGDVEIATTVCEDGPGPTPCPSGNTSAPAPFTNLLIAYRIPDGVGAPDQLVQDGDPSVTFSRDTSYSDSLTAVAAPPAGEHWVGYRSDTNPSFVTAVTFKPHFTLPKPDGKPFKGPFKWRTVTGYMNDQSADMNAPVACADPPTGPGPADTDGSQSRCIDSPTGTTYQTDQELATRDLTIAAGNGGGLQNESAQLAFSAEFAGAADPSASFKVDVSSAAPGVKLTPSMTTLTPATDSTTAINVTADIAPTTPTGTYDVTLVASLPNGAERTATGKLTVGLGKPVNLALPDITGTDAVGKTVTCTNGDWSSSPAKFTYAWSRDGTAISGATAQTYALTQDDGARLVACTVTATNDAGSGQATSGPIRVAQEGGADVNLDGKPKVTENSDGTYTVDTGITVSCPPRLPKNCGGGNHITAALDSSLSRAAASSEVAHGGFTAKTGAKQKIVLKLDRKASRQLRLKKKLALVATVVTRNHLLQRVTSKKRFTVTRPR